MSSLPPDTLPAREQPAPRQHGEHSGAALLGSTLMSILFVLNAEVVAPAEIAHVEQAQTLSEQTRAALVAAMDTGPTFYRRDPIASTALVSCLGAIAASSLAERLRRRRAGA